MDRTRTRRLARALIAPAGHIADEQLDTSLDIALATYHALAGPATEKQAAQHSVSTSPGSTDDTGSYYILTSNDTDIIAASSAPSAQILVNGDAPRWRIASLTASSVKLKIYAARPDTTPTLVIRIPQYGIWPQTADAAIAMLAASYYIQALALSEPDPRRADALSDTASTYYGRATQMLRSQ
jgi:hypothetical protein